MTTQDNKNKTNRRIRRVCAIITAAGGSSRMNLNGGGSKQFIEICGKTVIERTVSAFESCGLINKIAIVARVQDIDGIKNIINSAGFKKVEYIVEGGKTRQESVLNALLAIGEDIDYAAVHDGARCLISVGDIEKVIEKAFETGAAAAATKVTDTIKHIDPENGGVIKRTVDRSFLWAVQTPQVFRRDLYMSGITYIRENLGEKGIEEATDDCSILEYAGYGVNAVECARSNIKITESSDIKFAEAILNSL